MQNPTTRIKNELSHQIKRAQEEIRLLDHEETAPQIVFESLELGTSAWHNSVRESKAVIKKNLLELLSKAKQSLVRLKAGTYGICESCGKTIEWARLQVIPTTTLCVSCK